MFNDVSEAIEYIESKRSHRSVDDFRETLNHCHILMKQKNMIHIAGTNGKGSTVNYLRSILNAHGYKVGTLHPNSSNKSLAHKTLPKDLDIF